MACNLLSRLFRRRERQLPVSANHCSHPPPALPAHSDKLQLQLSLEQLVLDDPESHDLSLLGYLSEQGSCTLVLSNIPFSTGNTSLHKLQSLPGFVGFERGASDTSSVGSDDVFVHFQTAADAAYAMAAQPNIVLGSGSSRRLNFHDGDRTEVEPAAKRQKTEPPMPLPKCLICCEEIDGPYVKPCFYCDSRWCHDCLKNNVTSALSDQERFPAKCCGRIVHFDVGRGIITASDYSKYRTRFEEHSTTRPLYCADPACSQFMPPRLAPPSESGQVRCFACQKVTCGQCRVLVDTDVHECTMADEMTALMKQFDYKRCPRCSMGVAKMFGCSHIRCQCGAHWCWDCQRAIQICWSKPCARAREDGEVTDDYDIPEEESDSDAEAASNPTEGTAQQTTATDPASQNTAERPAVQDAPIDGPAIEPAADRDVAEPTESSDLDDTLINADSFLDPTDSEDSPVSSHETAEMNSESQPVHLSAETPTQLDGINLETSQPGVAASLEYRPPVCLVTTPEPSAVPTQPAEVERPINLDGEDQDDWEAGSYNFGDEPIDETWDTWGCLHHFTPVRSAAIHEHWLPMTVRQKTSEPKRHIDCLRCYKTIVLPDQESKKRKEEERRDSGIDVSSAPTEQLSEASSVQTDTGPIVESAKNVKKKSKSKRKGNIPTLFNCGNCGVFYCSDCKKTTMKELNQTLGRTLIRD